MTDSDLKAAALQWGVKRVCERLGHLADEQRPRKRAKLESLAAAALRTGARLFAMDPKDVVHDLHASGKVDKNKEEELLDLLVSAQVAKRGRAPILRSNWPTGLYKAWLKPPPLSGKALAQWICDSAYVRIIPSAQRVVETLFQGSTCCIKEDNIVYEMCTGSVTDTEGSWLIKWDPCLEKSLKGEKLTVQAALCINLPEGYFLHDKVQEIRAKHDPAYERWPPHINVIYPFLRADKFTLDRVRKKLLNTTRTCSIVFDDVGVFTHGSSKTIFLKPDESSEKKLQSLYEQILGALPPPPGKSWSAKQCKGTSKGKGKGKGKGKAKGKDEYADTDEDADADCDEFTPHMTIAKDDRYGLHSHEYWKAWLRDHFFLRGPSHGIGAKIKGLDGKLWGTVESESSHSWVLTSNYQAVKEEEGRRWKWYSDQGKALSFHISKVSLCERTDDTPFGEVEGLLLGGPQPIVGIGGTIIGIDGDVWGLVVEDCGNVWKLQSGRIAKKETEGAKWKWALDTSCPAAAQDSKVGVGGVIVGGDGEVWGKVVEDGGKVWKLESGRIAKKETEGNKWNWAT